MSNFGLNSKNLPYYFLGFHYQFEHLEKDYGLSKILPAQKW